MKLPRLTQFATLGALRDRSAFLFDFKKRSICVMARRGAVAFDA